MKRSARSKLIRWADKPGYYPPPALMAMMRNATDPLAAVKVCALICQNHLRRRVTMGDFGAIYRVYLKLTSGDIPLGESKSRYLLHPKYDFAAMKDALQQLVESEWKYRPLVDDRDAFQLGNLGRVFFVAKQMESLLELEETNARLSAQKAPKINAWDVAQVYTMYHDLRQHPKPMLAVSTISERTGFHRNTVIAINAVLSEYGYIRFEEGYKAYDGAPPRGFRVAKDMLRPNPSVRITLAEIRSELVRQELVDPPPARRLSPTTARLMEKGTQSRLAEKSSYIHQSIRAAIWGVASEPACADGDYIAFYRDDDGRQHHRHITDLPQLDAKSDQIAYPVYQVPQGIFDLRECEYIVYHDFCITGAPRKMRETREYSTSSIKDAYISAFVNEMTPSFDYCRRLTKTRGSGILGLLPSW